MSTHVRQTVSLVWIGLLIVLLYTLPYIVLSAEDTLVPAVVTEAGTDNPTAAAIPYVTEPLLGDEIVGDFVVGPGKAEIEILPGQTKTIEITVSNRTGEERIFELSTEDAAGSNDPTQTIVLLGEDRGPYSMKDYVSFTAKRFALGSNQRARIPVTISIPADAEPGGLYGSVLVSTVSKEAQVGDTQGTAPQSAIVARIGSLLFITIPGEVVKEGALIEFGTLAKKKFFQSGPINPGILFENTGAIHLAPYGEIRIYNILGEEVGQMELEPWFVLPKSERLREVSWNRELLFGRYTATAHINRSYNDVVDTMTFTFWVLPWKALAVGFVGIFTILFIIRAFFRNFEFKRKS